MPPPCLVSARASDVLFQTSYIWSTFAVLDSVRGREVHSEPAQEISNIDVAVVLLSAHFYLFPWEASALCQCPLVVYAPLAAPSSCFMKALLKAPSEDVA